MNSSASFEECYGCETDTISSTFFAKTEQSKHSHYGVALIVVSIVGLCCAQNLLVWLYLTFALFVSGIVLYTYAFDNAGIF